MKKFLFSAAFLAVVILLAYLLQSSHRKTVQTAQTNVQPDNFKHAMNISSSAFENNQNIPSKYTCDGDNTNPPLIFSDVSKQAKSLVLIMDDPDAPMGTFVHWVLYNISSSEQGIKENSVPAAKQGKNSTGKEGYIGACPPNGKHRYFFKLYALDKELDFSSPLSKEEVEQKMKGHVLDSAELIGLYQRGV